MKSNHHPPTHLPRCATAQRGITLLEVILGLAILAAASVGLNQLANRFSADARAAIAASQLRTFGEAARSYIKDNYAAVQAVASATTPALIDVATLTAAGKLPAGFSATNSYGQSTCALVFEPAANRLQALVLTEGGTPVDDPTLGSIAAALGGSGGGVYATAPDQIRGSAGGWSLAAIGFDNLANHLGRRCDGSTGAVRLAAGHAVMALWFDNGDAAAPFVMREAVPGRPELNAMNTPLVMNAARTLGAACTTSGAIAQDGSGRVLSCQASAWRLVGDGMCIYTAADVNTLQRDGRCYNGAGLANSPAGSDWAFVEVFRHHDHGVHVLVQRVIGMNGSSVGKVWMRTQNASTSTGGWSSWWQQADPNVSIGGSGAGTISATGTISTSGTVWANAGLATAGQVSGGQLYSSGTVQAATSVHAGNSMIASAGVYGSLLSSSGDVQAAGNAVSNNNALNYNGSTYNFGDSWGFLAFGTGGGQNSEPASARGSAYVNDVFLRSKGLWASQLSRTVLLRTGSANTAADSVAYCASGESVVGGSCWAQDICTGNDSSMHGGYPSGNAWVCPGWHCNVTQAFATCTN